MEYGEKRTSSTRTFNDLIYLVVLHDLNLRLLMSRQDEPVAGPHAYRGTLLLPDNGNLIYLRWEFSPSLSWKIWPNAMKPEVE